MSVSWNFYPVESAFVVVDEDVVPELPYGL